MAVRGLTANAIRRQCVATTTTTCSLPHSPYPISISTSNSPCSTSKPLCSITNQPRCTKLEQSACRTPKHPLSSCLSPCHYGSSTARASSPNRPALRTSWTSISRNNAPFRTVPFSSYSSCRHFRPCESEKPTRSSRQTLRRSSHPRYDSTCNSYAHHATGLQPPVPLAILQSRSRSKSPHGIFHRWRRCASTRSEHETNAADWPIAQDADKLPSPYAILRQHPGKPYCRRRFNELVKLYHPDRIHLQSATGPGTTHPESDIKSSCQDGPSTAHLHPATRLERYRLIIAANDILSDPARRSAYDRSGAGWHGPSSAHVGVNSAETFGDWSSTAAAAAEPSSPFQNATWEDWEAWHRERYQTWRTATRDQHSNSSEWWEHEPERPAGYTDDMFTASYGSSRSHRPPVFMSHARFVVLLVAASMFLAFGEMRRAARKTRDYASSLETRHAQARQDLVLRQHALGFESGRQRLDRFLDDRARGPAGSASSS